MTTLAVVGCSGGLGASTFATALGVGAVRAGRRAVVVDGDVAGGGLQVTAGVEHLGGYRWVDLIEVDGPVDGGRLLERLPQLEGLAVLSAGRPSTLGLSPGPLAVPDAAFLSVCRSLDQAADLTVIDWGGSLPRPDARVGSTIVLVGLTPRGLADAEAWLARHDRQGLVGLVARGGRGDDGVSAAVAQRLALPLLGRLGDDRSVRAAERRGRSPGSGRGSVRRLAAELVAAALADVPRADAPRPVPTTGARSRR